MSVFISYAHEDKTFVETLGANLFKRNFHIFIDRWELKVGDSLLDHIQAELKDCSFVCCVLSKASISSEWCRREINAGLMRELSERRTVLLPLLIEDCEIPPFLKDKVFADFRNDYESGLDELLNALAKISNPSLGRVTSGPYHNDYAVSWKYAPGKLLVEIYAVCFSKEQEWSVLIETAITANQLASERFGKLLSVNSDYAVSVVLGHIATASSDPQMVLLLSSAERVDREIRLRDRKLGFEYTISIQARRLGADPGKDVVIHFGGTWKNICEDYVSKTPKFSDSESAQAFELLKDWNK